jgi:hypothetical protein
MTNTKTATITVSGLALNSKYKYEFIGAGANWPTVLSNPTGVFSTNNSLIKTIKTNVHFCTSTGICPSNAADVLDYDINECRSDPVNLYSNLNFILRDYDTNQELYNDTIEVTCSGCVPKVSLSTSTSIGITNSNIYQISVGVTGLSPKQSYNYSFVPLSANWPTTLSTITGSFLAKDDYEIVTSDITFCPTTGVCQTAGKTVSSYTLDNNCINGTTNPAAKVRFTLTPTTCTNDLLYTDPISITCNNCLPRLTITGPTDTLLSSANNNLYTLTHNISGLRVNESYSYSYSGIKSNWPTILNPSSGSFAATGIIQSVSTKLMFCSPKSICPSGTPGLIDYSLDSYAQKILKQNVLSTSLQLTVTPQSCEIPAKISTPFTFNCSGCLPSFSYSSINFEDTPELLLSGACCTGMKPVSVNVSGAVPGDEYTFLFSSVSSGVEFAPATGYAYFDSDGGGYINTIMSADLIASQQLVVTCELTHADTQIKTIDFLAVKCSGACV